MDTASHASAGGRQCHTNETKDDDLGYPGITGVEKISQDNLDETEQKDESKNQNDEPFFKLEKNLVDFHMQTQQIVVKGSPIALDVWKIKILLSCRAPLWLDLLISLQWVYQT
jgi:hypothetical protein